LLARRTIYLGRGIPQTPHLWGMAHLRESARFPGPSARPAGRCIGHAHV